MLGHKRLSVLLRDMARLRLVVVGDLMLDRYCQGSAERLSPEAPVPVVRVRRELCVPGGAANVAANIAALGARVDVAGLMGRDADGAALKALLTDAAIECGGILCSPRLSTIVKTRVVADRQQVVRVDREASMALDAAAGKRFRDRIRRVIAAADGVILEDYGKGTLTQDVVDWVLEAAAAKGIPVGFDPKDNHDLRLQGVSLVTPNWREAVSAAGLTLGADGETMTPDALDRVADRLMAKWAPGLLIMTLGPMGMYLAPRKGPRRLIPTRAREVFDVSGAGDTVIASCLLALAVGASAVEAAEIGNHAAGIVVGKLGTASCSAQELIERVSGLEAENA